MGNASPMTALRARLPSRYADPTLIAHGGMADVYRATDETLHRTVAVKVLSERFAADQEFRARFLREARTAASLSGEPYVVTIHDVGETEDGLPFIVMEHAPGGTVADRLRNGVPFGQALDWLEQAAIALDRAHARGVIHRDVKPGNLLVAADDTVRVSDFGIARAVGQDTLTAAGTILGSVGYMAPEQARGETITPATDRYALACVAFELLARRRPFARDTQAAELQAHSTEPPPPIRDVDPTLPPAVDDVFARGLAKAPDDRHGSASELVGDLRAAMRGPTTMIAERPARTAPVRHSSRPRYGLAMLLAAILVAAGGLLGWLLTATSDEAGETTRPRVIQRTVTERVTTQSEPEAPAASATELNDQGFRLLQQGEADQALPLLESAVAQLQGSGSTTEAYASYNLAWARFAVGRCDGVMELLARSEAVQGERTEIDRLRSQVEARCGGAGAEGNGRGRGKGKGKGKD